MKGVQDARRDAAADEDAAGGERGQREIAGCRAVHRDEQLKRSAAFAALSLERAPRNLRGQDFRDRLPCRGAFVRIHEPVDVDQARAGQHLLEIGSAKLMRQRGSQHFFPFVPRGEVNVSAF